MEIAVSVLKEWQGKGIAGVILAKLAQSAIENGYSGLVAYTALRNTSMIKLFKKLPYQVKTSVDDEFFVMTCRFSMSLPDTGFVNEFSPWRPMRRFRPGREGPVLSRLSQG